MAKSILNTISSIMEVAQPLSQGEQNFKALHGDLTPTNRDVVPGVTDQDFLFKGGERKMDPKTASYENDEESKKEYDKTLKMREEVEEVDEAKLAMPLKGHPYHTKTHAELKYIQKDASEAAKANKGRESEGKYLDQMNDASTILHYRSKGGQQLTKEETEQLDEKEWKMKGQAEYEARYDGKGKKKKPALDPVGKEDDDVNNDGKTDSSDSYLKNRRKVVSKYLKKEEVEPVAEAMKGQAEYDARYGAGGKKRPNPEPKYHPEKKKEKTDWKELLTRKKKVTEEIEEDTFSHVKSFKLNDYMVSVHEGTTGIYAVINPVSDEEYFTEDYEDACNTAKTILRQIVKESPEYLDEISRDMASRYIQRAKADTRDAYYGDDAKTTGKRVKGIEMALLKKWGDKKYGTPEPKVKATEEVNHVEEGAKVDRMEKHIEKSEIAAGKSPEKAKKIAWATLNKRGFLNRGK